MLLGYLMNDLLREYVASGEFTRRGKWCSAFREAAMFYVPALLVGIIIVVYMMIQTGARLARLDAAAPCTQAATLCIRAATLGSRLQPSSVPSAPFAPRALFYPAPSAQPSRCSSRQKSHQKKTAISTPPAPPPCTPRAHQHTPRPPRSQVS